MNSDAQIIDITSKYIEAVGGKGRGLNVVQHLKMINRIMSSEGNDKDKVNKLVNTTTKYLDNLPNDEGNKNIEKLCEMNTTVMPYIVDHYNQTDKNEENRVTVYNKINKEQSFWYNFFYGIIFGIEKNLNEKALAEGASEIKIDRKSMQVLQSNLAGLCKSVQFKKGGKLMTGGMAIHLLGALFFTFVGVASATLPSGINYVANQYPVTSVAEQAAHALEVGIPVVAPAVAVGAAVLGEVDLAVNIVELGFKGEVAAIALDLIGIQYLGLADDARSDKHGEVANKLVEDIRDVVDTGKDMVSEKELLSETLYNKLLTKKIKVNGNTIEQHSADFKAIQATFRFLNGRYEAKVFAEIFPKLVAEWKTHSVQSSNPARDTKGVFRGNLVTYKDVSDPGVKFINQVEANYKELARKAGIDEDGILQLSKVMKDLDALYFSDEITISDDTLQLMNKLGNAINAPKDNKGINSLFGLLKQNDIFDDNKEAFDEFKESMDGLELNVYASVGVWLMRHASKFGIIAVLITSYMNSNKNSNNNRTWTQWFTSWVSSSEKEGSSATGGKRRTKSRKNKKRKTKKNHKRRNKKRVK